MDWIRVKTEDGVFKHMKKPRTLKEGAIGEVHLHEGRLDSNPRAVFRPIV